MTPDERARRRADALAIGAAVADPAGGAASGPDRRRGRSPRGPDLDHAANYLWMTTGQEPSEQVRSAINAYLVSTVDHGFNASTFTARVVASTGADLGAVVTAALGSLSGPLARRRTEPGPAAARRGRHRRRTSLRPASRSRPAAGSWASGTPSIATEDPRSALMKEVALGFGGRRVDLAIEIEAAVLETLELAQAGPRAAHERRVLRGTGDGGGAASRPRCSLPTFAVARVLGWTAHALEQARDRQDHPAGRPLRRPAGRGRPRHGPLTVGRSSRRVLSDHGPRTVLRSASSRPRRACLVTTPGPRPARARPGGRRRPSSPRQAPVELGLAPCTRARRMPSRRKPLWIDDECSRTASRSASSRTLLGLAGEGDVARAVPSGHPVERALAEYRVGASAYRCQVDPERRECLGIQPALGELRPDAGGQRVDVDADRDECLGGRAVGARPGRPAGVGCRSDSSPSGGRRSGPPRPRSWRRW